ncbi:MAG: carboxypeptidase regulatory-like domain-containing protein, partial [Calditrichota bacterium]
LFARNLNTQAAIANVVATVTTESPWVEIENGQVNFGNIAAGGNAEGQSEITLHISPACPDGETRPRTKPRLLIDFSSGNNHFPSALELTPAAPHFTVKRIVGGDQIPADRQNLDIEIENVGNLNAAPSLAAISTQGLGVSVVMGQAHYPAVNAGRSSRVQNERFLVAGNRIAVPGMRNPMMMVIETETGFIDTAYFELQVGAPRQNAPQGPDNYGYICFDDTDSDWDMAPDYNWLEINPRDQAADYEGTSCNFRGQSDQNVGESVVVRLPFETQFYGRVYDRITICTNGYIAVGDQARITNFQNWPMEYGIGAGMGMIAPFWDRLAFGQNVNSQVYYYYDEDEARFIVEWYHMRHAPGTGNQDLNFQVIIYDRDIWITETGDQNILFQYKSIANAPGQIDGGVEREKNNPYATVGISSPDGTTGLTYTWLNEYPVTSATLAARRAILYATSPRFRSGTLLGRVVDAETNQPIAGAIIYTEHGFTAVSDADGNWRINDALAEIPFDLTAMAQGYNDSTLTDLIVAEDDELEINFALLHPEFIPSVDALGAELEVDESTDLRFNLNNEGNGPLTWRAERQLRGDVNAQPWELRRSYAISQLTGDARLQGVVFANDNYYIAGSHNQDPQIYVLSRDGEVIDQFDQEGVTSQYGFGDLTWDGQWIWGSGERDIFGINLEGELERSFSGPANPNSNLTWDPDHEWLWACGTVTDPTALTRDGQVVRVLSRKGLRIYGLAYWPDDPDGYNLYIYHCPSGNVQWVHKMNIANGDTLLVRSPQQGDAGRAQGCHISNMVDYYSWVFISIANDAANDHLNIWQLDARRDWFRLAPVSGTLQAGQTQAFTLTLDATGLPTLPFVGDIHFFHNADDGITLIPVQLDVLGGRRHFQLNLHEGWNLVSLNVRPDDLVMTHIMTPLTQAGALEMVKNGAGQFYRPSIPFDNIGNWAITEGYHVAVDRDTQLVVQGVITPSDDPIQLQQGWNMAAYFPRMSLEVRSALASIQDQLEIAKDGAGRFYFPEYDFSNMGNLTEGQGYQLKLTEDAELIYPAGDQAAALRTTAPVKSQFYQPIVSGGDNMSVLVLGHSDQAGWELGVRNRQNKVIGSGVFDDQGRCGLAAWGDSETTTEADGAVTGEPLRFYLWDGIRERDAALEPVVGETIWSADGMLVGKLLANGTAPMGFGIREAYPNPANGPMRLTFGLEKESLVRVSVYDMNGREAARLVNGRAPAGRHAVIWNTDPVASGIYLIQLEAAGRTQVRKVAVVK